MDPFFSIVEEAGCFFYILPAGTSLFRGDTNFDQDKDKKLKQGPIFFAIDPVYAETYGIASEFKVTEDIKVVALDKSLDYLYNHIRNEKIKKILEKNYGYNPANPKDINGKRSSDNKSDTALVNHLCSLDFEGYGANNMKTDFGGVFSPEIVLCDSSKVRFIGRVTTDDKLEKILEKNKLRNVEKNRITRKKRNSPSPEGSGPRQRLFGSPSRSSSKTPSPRKSPRKTLFFNSGGKKSKKRKRHKK
jgi:hypothetical protein